MNSKLYEVIPNTPEERSALVQLWFGGAVGWLTSPGIWLCWGPLAWLSLLAATAAQESGFRRDAVGDAGASVGMLQFGAQTWAGVLPGHAASDRLVPFWQGVAAARYMQAALTSSVWWWRMLVPVLGLYSARYLWTSGPSSRSARAPWWDDTPSGNLGLPLGQVSRDLAASRTPSWPVIGRSLGAYLYWRVVTALLVVPVVVLVLSYIPRSSRGRA